MKKKTEKKRSYSDFLTRTFAVMAASTLAVGITASWFNYQNATDRAIEESWNRITDFQTWMNDPENADATDAEIRMRLSLKLAADNWYIDRGAVLREIETNEVYDSSQLLWCFIKVRADSGDRFTAVQEAAKEYPFLDNFNEKGDFAHYYICEDQALLDSIHAAHKSVLFYDYGFDAAHVYVKDDAFIPTDCTVTTFSRFIHEGDVVSEVPVGTTPEIPEGSVHFVKKDAENIPADALAADAVFLVPIGSEPGSPALQEAHELFDWCRTKELYDYDVDKTFFSPVWGRVMLQ